MKFILKGKLKRHDAQWNVNIHITLKKTITSVFQTEASRRRREAEVQQAMENGLGSCMYICMFFTYISQFTAHTEFKSVPFASPLNATLLRNEFSWVRYPTSAWHVKIAKKSTKIPE